MDDERIRSRINKRAKKGILEEAREIENKKNYTFRLKPSLMREFYTFCEREKVTATNVLEKLLSEFLKP